MTKTHHWPFAVSKGYHSLRSLLLLCCSICLFSTSSLAQDGKIDQTGDETTTSPAQDPASVQANATDNAGAAEASSGGGIPSDEAIINAGKPIYQANCKQCHAINEVVVGPALKDVHTRWELSELIQFIKYPQKVIESGNPYAKKLYEQYKQMMPNHDFLSDAEVLSVVAYIKAEGEKPAETASAGDGGMVEGGQAQGGGNSEYLPLIVGALFFLLIIVLVVLVLMLGMLSKMVEQKQDLTEEDKEFVTSTFSFGKFASSSFVRGAAIFIFVIVAGKFATDGVLNIGIQQGYAPTQPIPFSHKLHAGEYQIDCNYCHTGVRKSKNANIPSANICMNCHNTIKTGSPEIQKIYRAIQDNRPIEWVRVHNLPDLAYFNHAQHVAVAGLECQTCHGPVEEMEVVQQYSPLTMGWCINCHRETSVNTQDNAYYDKLVELHEVSSKEPLKVVDIGGLECSKCHY